MNSSKYLTTGKMAHLNGVSEKTLRLYQEKGVLEPAYVDERTGFRYYTVGQSSRIDAIQQLQHLGFSLAEIAGLFNQMDSGILVEQIKGKLAAIRCRQEELRIAECCAESLIASFEEKHAVPICEQVILEQIPPKRIIVFDVDSEYRHVGLTSDASEWVYAQRALKLELSRRGIPSLLFRNVGCIISRESIDAGVYEVTKAFVLVDEHMVLSEENALLPQILPGGQHLTMYARHAFDAEGVTTIARYLDQMLNYARANNFEIAGDYYDEILFEGDLFDYRGGDSMLKMCLPVSS